MNSLKQPQKYYAEEQTNRVSAKRHKRSLIMMYPKQRGLLVYLRKRLAERLDHIDIP